jgi:leucyl aminopeptidase
MLVGKGITYDTGGADIKAGGKKIFLVSINI